MSPRTPLFDPTDYFSDAAGDDSRLAGYGVFVLYAFLELAWLYVGIRLLFGQATGLDARLEREAMSMVSGLILITAIIFVVAWLVVAAVMHFGSGGSETDGSFADALGVAGWAYAPEVTLFLPAVLYAWQEIQEMSFDGSDPERLAAEFEAVAAQAELALVPVLLLLVSTVWSVFILAYGVAETHDVPVETAALPAVVVGAGSVVLFLIG